MRLLVGRLSLAAVFTISLFMLAGCGDDDDDCKRVAAQTTTTTASPSDRQIDRCVVDRDLAPEHRQDGPGGPGGRVPSTPPAIAPNMMIPFR
jgi:hypothetical protein